MGCCGETGSASCSIGRQRLGTSLTPMERRHLKAEKKYRQVRDKILTFWSQNETRWVDLERSVLECERGS